jgi:hypothetical protein
VTPRRDLPGFDTSLDHYPNETVAPLLRYSPLSTVMRQTNDSRPPVRDFQPCLKVTNSTETGSTSLAFMTINRAAMML